MTTSVQARGEELQMIAGKWQPIGPGVERFPVPGGWLYRTWLAPVDPSLAALGGRMQTAVTFVPAAEREGPDGEAPR